MSMKLTWSEALASGDRAPDVQHKYLIEIINELAEAIETGQAAQSLRKILNLLQYYTEWHFGREEMCMDRRNCPMAGANKAAHQCFLKIFQDFAAEYKQSGGSDDIARRMYATLTDWLVNHIQAVDASMVNTVDASQPTA